MPCWRVNKVWRTPKVEDGICVDLDAIDDEISFKHHTHRDTHDRSLYASASHVHMRHIQYGVLWYLRRLHRHLFANLVLSLAVLLLGLSVLSRNSKASRLPYNAPSNANHLCFWKDGPHMRHRYVFVWCRRRSIHKASIQKIRLKMYRIVANHTRRSSLPVIDNTWAYSALERKTSCTFRLFGRLSAQLHLYCEVVVDETH